MIGRAMAARSDETGTGSAEGNSAVANGDGPQITGDYSMTDISKSEPVPATNQAGEVEEALGHIEWLCDIAYNQGGAHELGYDPLKVVRAALATQPATSQEGEGRHPDWTEAGHRWLDAGCPPLDATPTPPTLSEDLREARVYLAARFSRRHECNALGHILKSHGCTITSRWVKPDCEHVLPTGISEQAADHERQQFALEDVEDVRAANWTISFMEEPRGNSRGGRHIEFGMAVALGHRLTIIGPRETVFHHLPNVEQFDTVADFTAALAQGQAS